MIPMGRRNWLFNWTEVGAKHVGVVQSLLVTCRLQGVDPYAAYSGEDEHRFRRNVNA